jgi:hypothetical protein
MTEKEFIKNLERIDIQMNKLQKERQKLAKAFSLELRKQGKKLQWQKDINDV